MHVGGGAEAKTQAKAKANVSLRSLRSLRSPSLSTQNQRRAGFGLDGVELQHLPPRLPCAKTAARRVVFADAHQITISQEDEAGQPPAEQGLVHVAGERLRG